MLVNLAGVDDMKKKAALKKEALKPMQSAAHKHGGKVAEYAASFAGNVGAG